MFFLVGSALYWVYEIYKILREMILLGGHAGWSLFLHVIFLLATLIAMAILYRLAFPLPQKKMAELSIKKEETLLIEEMLRGIEILLEKWEKTFCKIDVEKVVQAMRDSRKNILTGKNSGVLSFSISDFQTEIEGCAIRLELMQKALGDLEKEIETSSFISQKQQSEFLRRILAYQRKLIVIKDVLDKYRSVKV